MIAECHEGIVLGHNMMLFGKGWEMNWKWLCFGWLDAFYSHAGGLSIDQGRTKSPQVASVR